MEWFRRFLFGNPLVQALGLGLLGILANILSGAYVFDTTRTDAKGKQHLDWWSTPHSAYFWCLCGVLALMGIYGWGIASIGTKVRRALSEEAIRARAVDELLGPFLDQMKVDISQGKLKSLPEAFRMLGIEMDHGP